MAKKSPSSNQSKETKETENKTVPCNIDNNFSIEEELADDVVIFELTDYSSPVSRDITKSKQFQKSRKAINERTFVQMFKSNFESNGAFENVNSAEKIYRIHTNLSKDIVEKRWENKIAQATKGMGATDKNRFVESILEEKKKLRLNGGLQIVTKFIHVPGLESDKMPEDV